MNQPANVVLPRAYWYAVSVVVLVVGIGLAVWQVGRSAATARGDAHPVRDQELIQLKQAGSYSLYIYRAASQRMDAATNHAWDTAKDATVTVHDDRTGTQLAVKSAYETEDLHETLIARLVEFEVPAPGTFRVQISPALDKLKPSVLPSVSIEELGQRTTKIVVGFIIGLGIGALAFVIAATIFFVVLLRRRSFKKRQTSTLQPA